MKLTKFGAALIAAIFALQACDEIKEEDRFIELPAVEANRVVLLEEFTGQFCVNCPPAHQIIADLLSQYPDNLVAVSIHAGGDAFSIGEGQYDGVVGLRIPEGEALAASHGVTSFPMGIVNRSSAPLTSDSWAAAIRSEIIRPASLELSLSATINEDNEIEITTLATPYDNITGTLNIWIVENDIEAMQIQPDGNVKMDYRHNHVFRAAVTPVEGESVALVTREPRTFSHKVALHANWEPANLAVIAFISTPSGIAQATESGIE